MEQVNWLINKVEKHLPAGGDKSFACFKGREPFTVWMSMRQNVTTLLFQFDKPDSFNAGVKALSERYKDSARHFYTGSIVRPFVEIQL